MRHETCRVDRGRGKIATLVVMYLLLDVLSLHVEESLALLLDPLLAAIASGLGEKK